MYIIKDNKFHNDEYGTEKYLKNWPMLYILENGREAYVGESTNVISRMTQHKSKPEKQDFTDVHFIYSKEFNQSVTFDYESKLIQLFSADEKYVITNANTGLADKEYFNKEYYDNDFQSLWERLRNKKITKHSIDEITNSDLFKYSPYKALNDSQREAVEEIFRSIETNQEQPIIVNGMPGSGKTIVAVFLYKLLRDYVDENDVHKYADKKIALVIPQTSLRKTLKNLFNHIHGLRASDVIGPSDIAKEYYDIVLVDEAHRLHQRKNIVNYKSHDDNNKKLCLPTDATELDWILKQAKCPILFFDADQVVGPSGIAENILKEKLQKNFQKRMATYYTLLTQMRVKGGNGYIDYIKNIFSENQKEKMDFDSYELKIVNHFSDFDSLLFSKEKECGLSRMVAGYAWPWISKKDKSLKDITLEGISKMWNNKTENWVHCDNAINEVGCIHSIQGYDLNYAFVIIGNDLRYDSENQCIVVNKDSYYDANGKATASDEELLQYIINIYYVLMTRGINGTYLYICDKELKEYIGRFIDQI